MARANSIGGRIGRLLDYFGRGDCPECRRWRETRVFILGAEAEMPPPVPPAPARCPACLQPVPPLTHSIFIIGPGDDDDENSELVGE